MFEFDNFVEHWAEIYKPVSHKPEGMASERRFYRMDTYEDLQELGQNLSNALSPAVAVETNIEIDTKDTGCKFFIRTLRVFFLVKQATAKVASLGKKEYMAARAKEECVAMATDFLAYMEACKKSVPELEKLDMSSAEIFTTPGMYNGWWAAELMINNLTPRNKCVNPELYSE